MLCAVIAFALAVLLTVFCKNHPQGAVARMILIGCTAGFLWFGLYDSIFVAIPRIADGEKVYVTIQATDYGYHTDYGSAVEGAVEFNGRAYKVKAYVNSKEAIEPGDLLTGLFRFRLTTDGGREDPTHHRSEGIFLLAYPIGNISLQKRDELEIRHYPAIWRRQILNRIQLLMPGQSGAFACALLLGERSGITYEMDTAFKVSGISHVIAVSGLHVSILCGLLYTLLARRRLLSCLIGIPVLFLFAAVAGFTPSITRACIMQSLMLIAMVIDREYDGPTALSFAVLVMLGANPLTIMSVSFQLSVGCMVGIFLFSEPIRQYLLKYGHERIPKERKRLRSAFNGVASSVSVTLSATAVTTPLVAWHFGCVSILGVITNLLTLWVISFIFYGVILCLVISLVSVGFAQMLGSIAAIPIQYVLFTSDMISRMPMAAAYTSNIYVVIWLIGVYVMLAIFLLSHRKQPMLLTTCIIFTYLLTQLLSWTEPMLNDFRVTMLDVGQGQSILLQSDGKTFLVDCGGDDDEDTADITAEALLSQGISRLDGIIVTHFDADHAGGVLHLLSRIRTDRLILPDIKDKKDVSQEMAQATSGTVEYVNRDLLYTFGDTEMTVFSPISDESDNENSICILFRRQDCGILITGDRGITGENDLLQRYDLPQVDVLVAGHHGSAGSTTMKLLETVLPETVLISVGEDNRYGHPADALLKRLMETGCEIYRTDIHGTIIFRR